MTPVEKHSTRSIVSLSNQEKPRHIPFVMVTTKPAAAWKQCLWRTNLSWMFLDSWSCLTSRHYHDLSEKQQTLEAN